MLLAGARRFVHLQVHICIGALGPEKFTKLFLSEPVDV